jgi:heterotetrameric sarcosine oxidase gamma subunit
VADAPLARSAITPLPPVVTTHGWEVSARRSTAQLRLADRSPLAKVQLRADPAGPISDRFGVPAGRAVRDERGTLIVGSGPGEWLLLDAPGRAPELLARCAASTQDAFATVLDLTHGRALVRLTGSRADDALSKICGIDLSDRATPDGAALRTFVARVVTDIVRDDVDGTRSYLLHCERSTGQHLYDTVLDAGREFGIEQDGFYYPEE